MTHAVFGSTGRYLDRRESAGKGMEAMREDERGREWKNKEWDV